MASGLHATIILDYIEYKRLTISIIQCYCWSNNYHFKYLVFQNPHCFSTLIYAFW